MMARVGLVLGAAASSGRLITQRCSPCCSTIMAGRTQRRSRCRHLSRSDHRFLAALGVSPADLAAWAVKVPLSGKLQITLDS